MGANSTILYQLCVNGESMKILSLIKDYPNDKVNFKVGKDSDSPLHAAAAHCDALVVETLIKKYHADVNIQNIYGDTPLLPAIRRGNVEIVNILLNNGAEVNSAYQFKYSPLHRKVLRGEKYLTNEIVKTLLNHGADIQKSIGGWTALHAAIEGRSEGAALILIENGANIHEKDVGGKTPLHYAVEGNMERVVVKLLVCKASPNEKDNFGNTPLHLSYKADRPSVPIRDQLMKYKADLSIKNNKNKRPFEMRAISIPMRKPNLNLYLGNHSGRDDDSDCESGLDSAFFSMPEMKGYSADASNAVRNRKSASELEEVYEKEHTQEFKAHEMEIPEARSLDSLLIHDTAARVACIERLLGRTYLSVTQLNSRVKIIHKDVDNLTMRPSFSGEPQELVSEEMDLENSSDTALVGKPNKQVKILRIVATCVNEKWRDLFREMVGYVIEDAHEIESHIHRIVAHYPNDLYEQSHLSLLEAQRACGNRFNNHFLLTCLEACGQKLIMDKVKKELNEEK